QLAQIRKRVGSAMLHPNEPEGNQTPDKEQIGCRRQCREDELKEPDARKSKPAECSLSAAKQDCAMFPDALQRSKRPSEALLRQAVQRIGGLRVRDRRVDVVHRPARTMKTDREILILGERVGAEPTNAVDGRLPPRTDGTWHHRDAIEQGERAPVEILARDVLERLQARHEVDAIADFRVPRDGSDLRVRQRLNERANRVGEKNSIRIEPDDDLTRRSRDAVVERARLAAVLFRQNADAPLAEKRALGDLHGVVAGAVVDDENLQWSVVSRRE